MPIFDYSAHSLHYSLYKTYKNINILIQIVLYSLISLFKALTH